MGLHFNKPLTKHANGMLKRAKEKREEAAGGEWNKKKRMKTVILQKLKNNEYVLVSLFLSYSVNVSKQKLCCNLKKISKIH